jgi:hypothetical protein
MVIWLRRVWGPSIASAKSFFSFQFVPQAFSGDRLHAVTFQPGVSAEQTTPPFSGGY